MLVEQGMVTIVFGLGQVAIRARRAQVRIGAGDLQFQVERIKFGEHLAAVDVIADIDETGLDLAIDAETELALEARMHRAGINLGVDRVGCLRVRDQRVARGFGHGGAAAAAGQAGEGAGRQNCGGAEFQGLSEGTHCYKSPVRCSMLNNERCGIVSNTKPGCPVIKITSSSAHSHRLFKYGNSMTAVVAKAIGPGRPKDLEKRAAILRAAKHLFTTQGFEGTSMDAIANAAGVSKLTVYSHYQDKERLFTAAVECVCQELMPPEIFNADLKGPIRRQLLTIARAFFELVTSEEALAIHRTIVANARQSPRLAELFWEAGPRRTQLGLESFLRDEVAAGKLDIPD